jgi:hypothetical protein
MSKQGTKLGELNQALRNRSLVLLMAFLYMLNYCKNKRVSTFCVTPTLQNKMDTLYPNTTFQLC